MPKDIALGIRKSLDEALPIIKNMPETKLLEKPNPDKWSKKEILGHLIDSARANLRRFAEIQFVAAPYRVISYNQDELVRVNFYQDLPLEHIVSLLDILNQQIVFVLSNYTIDPERIEITYENARNNTAAFLIKDYLDHLNHHLRQVIA